MNKSLKFRWSRENNLRTKRRQRSLPFDNLSVPSGNNFKCQTIYKRANAQNIPLNMFHDVLEIEEKTEAIIKYGLLTAMPVSLPLEGEFLRYYLTSVSRCLLALAIPSCDNLRCFHSAIFRVHHIDEKYYLENLGLILPCQKI